MGTVRYTVIDGEVIAEKRNGVRSLYVPDPLGSTVALLDNTQTPTDTFSYWPYGENNARTGTTATPFQFVGTAGYFRDSGTRTYVRARTLDTAAGRWITNDPIGFAGDDWNLYRYAWNEVTSIIDASGMRPCTPAESTACLAGVTIPPNAIAVGSWCNAVDGSRFWYTYVPPFNLVLHCRWFTNLTCGYITQRKPFPPKLRRGRISIPKPVPGLGPKTLTCIKTNCYPLLSPSGPPGNISAPSKEQLAAYAVCVTTCIALNKGK